jgi:2-polyprenyl-3-methyl-5-hydroxy-6-metoxy-1,4-benzoquinol methylase
MSTVRESSKDQERWDEIGRQRLDQIVKDPTAFVTDSSPCEAKAFHDDLLTSPGPPQGKRILELGSGRGEFSVFLAKQGAEVTGIDIGSHLVEASQPPR